MQVAKWLRDNAPGYAGLSYAEKVAIRDFPVLWALFEWRVCEGNATPRHIVRVIERDGERLELTQPVEVAHTYFSGRYFPAGNPPPEFYGMRLDHQFEDLVYHAMQRPAASIPERFTGLLLIINRLRNNYLHGTKQGYGYAGQFYNFTHANNVLMATIPHWPNR